MKKKKCLLRVFWNTCSANAFRFRKYYDCITFIFKFQIEITIPISYSDDSDSRSNFEYFWSMANIFTRRDLYVVSIETYAFDLSMQFLFSAFLNVLISKWYK